MTKDLTEQYDVLKHQNTKLCEQIENAEEILSQHEAYISSLEEENANLKELLKECREVAEFTKTIVNKHKWFNEVITKIDEVLK